MAETLRRLGDLAPGELSGPMLGFLDRPGGPGPGRGHRAARDRRAPALDRRRGRRALRVGLPERLRDRTGRESDPVSADDAVATIVRRFLQSHALIGLDDLTARYPIGPARARDLLERLADDGGLVRLVPAGRPGRGPMGRRAEPGRGPPAVDRPATPRERGRPPRGLRRLPGPSSPPPPVHAPGGERGRRPGPRAAARVRGPGRPLGDGTLPQAGPRLSAGLARRDHLDRRLALAGRGRAEARGEPRVAFVPRDFHGGWPAREEVAEPSEDEAPGPRSPGTSRRLLRERPGARARPGAVPDAAGPARLPCAGGW